MAKKSKKSKQKKKLADFKKQQSDMVVQDNPLEETVQNEKKVEMNSKKERKPRKGLGQELIEVYESTGDDLTSVTMLEHRRRSWQRMLLIILIFLFFVFIGVAVVSWIIWGGNKSFSGDNVEFSIAAPTEINSGQEVTYKIDYANREDVSFRKAEIELRLPPGFIFLSADPSPTTGENLWDLGSLSAGDDGSIEVIGKLVGKPEVDTTISGVLRYWPANFSSEFQEVASAQSLVKPVQALFRIEGPDQVLIGQKASYAVNVKNDSDKLMSDLQVQAIYPADFIVDSTEPEIVEPYDTWEIESIEPGQEYEIQIDGFFSKLEEPELELIVVLSQKGPEEGYFDQKEERISTVLIEGDLLVNLIANGTTKDTSAQWGDVINVSINYQNSSEAQLADLTVIAKLETRYRINEGEKGSAGGISFSSLIDANKGSVKEVDKINAQSVHVRTITWDGTDIDSLESLDEDEEGTINLQFSLLDAEAAIKALDHAGDAEIVLVADVIVGKTGGVDEEITVTSNPITIKLNTDLTMDAFARYYGENEEQLGNGPLPPTVGEKTTYRVFVDLTNSIHEGQDIIVSTQLPSNVSWVNNYSVSAGEVEFSSSGSDLTWRLNKLPLDVNEVSLAFDVELNPLETQIGKVAALTKKITMTATDSITGGKLIQTASPLTTAIDRDKTGSDKGLVTN